MVGELDLQTFKEISQGFLAGTNDESPWRWDSHCEAILCQFNADKSGPFDSLLEQNFLPAWNSEGVEAAPPEVKSICHHFGGVRGDQKLFTTKVDEKVVLVGAWWPWNGGSMISLRLLLWSPVPGQEADLAAELKSWFEV